MTLTKQILILSCSVTAVLAGNWIYGGISMTATAAPIEDRPGDAAITGEQSGPAGQIPAGSVSASIEGMLSAAMYGALPATDADAEANPDPLRMAYAIRIFDPVWEPRGAQAIQAYLRDIDARGLAVDAALMDRVDLAVISLNNDDPAARGRADLLLSQVFLELADHMRNGPFNDSPGLTERNEQITPQPLHTNLAYAGAGQFDYTSLDPAHREYSDLLVARVLYAGHVETGGFTPIPGHDGILERGDADPIMETLRLRLAEEGFETGGDAGTGIEPDVAGLISIAYADGITRPLPWTTNSGVPFPLDPASAVTETLPSNHDFDARFEAALIDFQEHNGLEPDGVVGPDTIDALNVTAEEKLGRIDANLERWRWAPADFGATHVRVNIPAFHVEGFQNGVPTIEMRTIVGLRSRQTPVFSDSIEHIIVNPRWYVPESILVRDKLEDIRNDPDFIANGGYFVLDRETGDRVEQDRINWHAEGVADRYRLVQHPGSHNALGSVKIIFPNRFSVYMHDTPTRSLFAPAIRAYSSGCIRLERAEDMARWVVRASGAHDSIAAMDEAWGSGAHVRIDLERPIPAHIVYYSVEMDDEGDVVFHRDIYNRDDRLIEALGQWELTLPDNGEI